jgi:TonB family protein
MSRLLLKSSPVSLLTVMFAAVVLAQEPTPTPKTSECSFRIVKGNEVDKKVKIHRKPEPKFTKRDKEAHGSERITLSAIFCGSGTVTDIRVTKGLSDAMDEAAIKAARQIQFTPAEKDGQKVSQLLTLVYFVRLGRGP